MTEDLAPGSARDREDVLVPRRLEDRAVMTSRERAELVLSFARVLQVNGQSTDETSTRDVRRRELVAELHAIGGDLVIVDQRAALD